MHGHVHLTVLEIQRQKWSGGVILPPLAGIRVNEDQLSFHFKIGGQWGADERSDLRFPIAEWSLPWQPIWGDLATIPIPHRYSLQRHCETVNGLKDCKADGLINSDDYLRTADGNLVFFGPK